MPQDGPRRVSLVFPIILITIGTLFLIRSYSPAFDPWHVVWTYWPLILIFVGLGKIYDNVQRSRNPNAAQGISVGATVGVVAFVALLVILIWHGRGLARYRGDSFREMQHSTRIVDLQNAKTARARLEMGAGQLTIMSGTNGFLDANFDYSSDYDAPHVDYNVSGGEGDLKVSQESHGPHFGRSRNDWTLRFNNDVPLELRVDMGAGQGNLHLREIPLTRLDLHLGAGQVDVDLTGDRKADLTADIQGGVGEANIRLPRNVGVIAHASGGIGSIDAHGGLHKDGDSYTNDAYGKSRITIRLKVSGGIGQINLTQE